MKDNRKKSRRINDNKRRVDTTSCKVNSKKIQELFIPEHNFVEHPYTDSLDKALHSKLLNVY